MAASPFLETQFDVNISYGSGGGPGFKTFVFEGHTGLEQRSIAWTRARAAYNVAQGIRNHSDMDTIRKMFYNVSGRAIGFRFKDWGDYQLTAENIGTGNGTNAVFKLTRTYTTGASSYVRRIFKPVNGTVQVYVGGGLQSEGAGTTQFVMDYTTGIITFGSAAYPANGLAVTVTCEFDTPVRFDTDQLNATHDGFLTETWTSIPLVEILLEDA